MVSCVVVVSIVIGADTDPLSATLPAIIRMLVHCIVPDTPVLRTVLYIRNSNGIAAIAVDAGVVTV